MFEMKPEYYIGIDMIDQEHKQLFDYASEAYQLLQEEFLHLHQNINIHSQAREGEMIHYASKGKCCVPPGFLKAR